MTQAKRAVLLVDPVKVGEAYKAAAKARGYAIVSVYTVAPEVLWARWPKHSETDDQSVYVQDVADVVRLVNERNWSVRAVVPAMESGVFMAGLLAREFGAPGNDPRLAWARRNKVAMRQRAAEVGLEQPEFQLVHDMAEVPLAAESLGYPVIVKQTMGAGSRWVKLVRNADEAAALRPDDGSDPFGWPVREWLVENYIHGRELAVNCYSVDGQHQIVDIWNYRQPSGVDEYDFPVWDNVQISRSDPDWKRAEAYVLRLLDAFGINVGPSHTEIKIRGDDVYLIELGARLPGGPATELWSDFTEIRPCEDALTCYLGMRPPLMDRDLGYNGAFGAIAIRNDDAPGTLVAIHGLEQLESHPCVTKTLIGFQPGDHIPVTKELRHIPVGAWLKGSDEAAVLKAMTEIRNVVSLEIIPKQKRPI